MNQLLYLTTWDFSDGPSSGITNKIKAQIKAFRSYGFSVDYTYIADNAAYFHKGGEDICLGRVGKLRKLAANYYLLKKLKKESYSYVYNRYGLMDACYYKLLKMLKKKGSKIIIEIPTYPYDKECLPGLAWWALYTMDKLYRQRIYPYIYRIATYSKDEEIFHVPAVQLKNGIDFDVVKMREPETKENAIHLVAVAGFTKAHGYDRLLNGLGRYYRNHGERNIIFHLVGSGDPEKDYRRIAEEYGIEEHCVFHGVQRGESLDAIYNYCDVGIESLGDFRNGIFLSSSLKSREYAAKGLPFVTACETDVFEGVEYVLKIPADETPVNIIDIVKFYEKLYNGKDKKQIASEIRSSAEKRCNILQTMEPIVNCLKRKENGA